MEIEVVVKGDDDTELGLVTEPSDSVPADWEEDESHVELESLGAAFGDADTVAHNVVHGAVAVLYEFPGEKACANAEPEQQHPHPHPVILHKVTEFLVVSLDGVGFYGWFQLLAQHLAQVPAIGRPWPH